MPGGVTGHTKLDAETLCIGSYELTFFPHVLKQSEDLISAQSTKP